jgi:hypothetical protein
MAGAAGRLEGVGAFLQALRHQSRGGPLARSSPLDLSARRLKISGHGPTVKGAERLPLERVAHASRAGRDCRDPWSTCVDGPYLQGSGAGGELRSPSPPAPGSSAWPTADRPGDISLGMRTIDVIHRVSRPHLYPAGLGPEAHLLARGSRKGAASPGVLSGSAGFDTVSSPRELQ